MDAFRASRYDALPYGGEAFYETHPDRLATVGRLFGLASPTVATSRVLELGCAEGGNLLPMALSLPGATLVGVDFSVRQIEAAEEKRRATGLTNVSFARMDIAEIGESFGSFDYVIAHGVYSWVPPEIQEKVLSICSRNLSPGGVAYVSYNTYPGWYLRGLVREILRYRVRKTDDPATQVDEARAYLEFLAKSARDRTETYGKILAEEAEQGRDLSPGHFFHETLEPDNRPCWFHEFQARAAEHGLTHFSDVNLASNPMGSLRPEVEGFLSRLTDDQDEKEQYLDFARNRKFRQSLLCHADEPFLREPPPEALERLLFTSRAKPPGGEVDLSEGAAVEFTSPDGKKITTNEPLLNAALATLFAALPHALTLDGIWEGAVSRLRAAGNPPALDGRDRLRTRLLTCLISDLAEAHVEEPAFVTDVSARPLASPVARIQAASGELITSLWHRNVDIDDFGRLVLSELDGKRDAEGLLADLSVRVAREGMLRDAADAPVSDPAVVRKTLEKALPHVIGRLARNALLVG
jgi:SAM-dependent methyltransferase